MQAQYDEYGDYWNDIPFPEYPGIGEGGFPGGGAGDSSDSSNTVTTTVKNADGSITIYTTYVGTGTTDITSPGGITYFGVPSANYSLSMLGAPYTNGVNQYGISRAIIQGASYSSAGLGTFTFTGVNQLNQINIFKYYVYTWPDGTQITGTNDPFFGNGGFGAATGSASQTSAAALRALIRCLTAKLANQVYETLNGALESGANALPSNVTLVPPALLPDGVKLTSDNSSFNSALYKIDNGNGNVEYIYATEGTISLQDWRNNVQQATGSLSEQYALSVDNAIKLKKWAFDNGYSLSFTGHSLGGGLANANALATGLPATIFNPAGLHNNTISNLHLNINNSKNVNAYVVRGEPVDMLNTTFNTPIRGITNYIGSSEKSFLATYGSSLLLQGNSLGLLVSGIDAYNLHKMGNVLSNLNCN